MTGRLIHLVLAMLVFAGAAQGQTVLAVNPALAVLGQEITPYDVTVAYPGPDGENASDWVPDSATLNRYQQADLVLLVGADYAGWVATTALPRARLIDTSIAFSDQCIAQASDIPDHRHGPTGAANHHSASANHFWLGPALARLQAQAIAGAFTALWPDHTDEIAARQQKLDQQLARIQSDLAREFAGITSANPLASHPVYQYLDRAHGLNLHNFHWEPDQHPADEDWAELDAASRTDRPNLMIWEHCLCQKPRPNWTGAVSG